MKFCDSHWHKMRDAIETRGLMPFVAKDGRVAVQQMAKQIEQQASGKDTFDPLMQVHWSGSVKDRPSPSPLWGSQSRPKTQREAG